MKQIFSCLADNLAFKESKIMKRILNQILLFCIVLISSHLYAQGSYSFKIVVNEENPVSSLSKDKVNKLFLKKTSKWDDGTKVLPVNYSSSSRIRTNFSKSIHGKPVASIKAYWQQKIFTGRGVPPVEKDTNREVLNYVKANPGAIGYVSTSVNVKGVKVVNIVN
jgi:ABC-type phosphate transport system substrate-binding protein